MTRLGALLSALALASCGNEALTTASPPAFDAAGRYSFSITLSVRRLADGYQTQLWCYGDVDLFQEGGANAALRGQVRYSRPECAAGTGLRGSVNAAGKVAFVLDGFKPYWPLDTPCPAAPGLSFSGELSTYPSLGTRLYATSATRVSCGALGEHEFSYAFDGWRTP